MTKPLFPVWLNPFVRESQGQLIHRSLWDSDWLTNPKDVTEEMRIVSRDDSHDIQDISRSESGTYIYYFDSDDGIKVERANKTLHISVTSAERIKNDPNRVIV